MIEQNPDKVEMLRKSLDLALKAHADSIYRQDPANRSYAKNMRLQAIAVRQLIEKGLTDEGESEITRVAVGKIKEMQPIIEIVFGVELKGSEAGIHREYTDTVFEGIQSRTQVVSTDTMHGSTVALDFVAADSTK